MSRMRIQLLAGAILVAATSLAGGTGAWASTAAGPHTQARVNVRPDTVVGYGFGTGPTAQAARKAALEDLDGDWRGCQPAILVYDVEGTDGEWSAELEANCQYAT